MTGRLTGRLAGRFALATLLCVSAGWVVARGMDDQGTPAGWFKGNTHTHTINSDGDSTPDEVVRWYREHGYQFLVLTDHNFLTSVDGLNALHGATGRFLVVRGEEVTDRFGDKPIHVNGLVVADEVAPQGGAKGVPHVNHPNYGWAITADELRQVENTKLIEIFNGHPLVNNLGGGGVPGLEQVWDTLLTSGRLIYGIAVDDAHTFKDPGNPAVAGPGRGWVMVRAPRLEARALVEALERGDFYATTGVVLADYQATPAEITVRVRPSSSSKYRIQFIGSGGRLLREATETQATYAFTGDEGYVRAKVLESNGLMAWCQPVRVARPPSR